MRKRLLLIYNPVAGKGEASRKVAPMIESFSAAGYEVTVQPVLPGHSTSQILKEADGVYSRVVCCGGDGTLNHLVNALMQMETPPPYGYLPTGSTNDFARSMGLPRRTKESCTAMLTGKPFCYDVGKFNDRYFNYVAAFGAFTDVSYLTSQDEKNSLGYLAYVIEGLKRLPVGRKFVAHDLHDHLVREFITPIERDDITVMASRIDDITDAIEDVLLRVYMFNVRELRDEMLPFVELIVRCTQALQDGLREFANFRKSKTVREKIIEINNLEDEGDRLYLTAMRRLFADGATAEEKLVWTELFDCCELCCDACEDVSDAMSRVIMNNT